jgi:hypothetical protein
MDSIGCDAHVAETMSRRQSAADNPAHIFVDHRIECALGLERAATIGRSGVPRISSILISRGRRPIARVKDMDDSRPAKSDLRPTRAESPDRSFGLVHLNGLGECLAAIGRSGEIEIRVDSMGMGMTRRDLGLSLQFLNPNDVDAPVWPQSDTGRTRLATLATEQHRTRFVSRG